MIADMGAALDWYYHLVTTNKWKVVRINMAPGMSQLVGTHPDVMKIMLKSGIYTC